MRFGWLESKAISILFFFSALIFLSLCTFVFLIAIPGVRQFLNNSSSVNGPAAISFFALSALAIPSMIVLFFGMAIFFVFVYDSSIGTKVLWFVLFLGTGPIGSTLYYFSVYRIHIKKKSAGAPDQRGVSA